MNQNRSDPLKALLTMDSLSLSPTALMPAFIFGAFAYVIILFFNMMVVITIVVNRKLHEPMFLILFNLPLSDMVGASAFFPQLLISIVSPNRSISYPACYLQALFVHLYGSGSLLTLTAMAFDRYIAICLPLRYSSIMTPNNVIRIIFGIWFIDFTLMLVLFGLLNRFYICRHNIVDVFCNNPSLVKLICEDTSVNNYYGLFTIVFLQFGSLVLLLFTYMHILLTCVANKQRDARSKAMQTCGTHLVVFLFLEINTALTLLAHRFEDVSPFLRRAFGVSVMVFPPILNPLIYGLNTKEIRQSAMRMVRRKVRSI